MMVEIPARRAAVETPRRRKRRRRRRRMTRTKRSAPRVQDRARAHFATGLVVRCIPYRSRTSLSSTR
jgi:hypothetical protein